MNFDDIVHIQRIDQKGMIDKIRDLPKQIESSWSFVLRQQMLDFHPINQILFAGISIHTNMIEILRNMIFDSTTEIFSLMNITNLPKGCKGKENLLILVLGNENFENMKNLLYQGIDRGCAVFVLLKNQSIKTNLSLSSVPHWVLEDQTFLRTTIGFDTFILYGILNRLGIVPNITEEMPFLISNLEKTIQHNDISIPSALNPAKRMAGQMMGRWVKIVAGGWLLPIANHWCNQINQSAKALCNAEDIFHLAEYSLSGIYNPESVAQQSMVIFLKSRFNNQKIENMIDQAKTELMCNGLGTDSFTARGEDLISQIWTTILFGDFLAYYLAIAYECDPTPIGLLS